MADELDDLLFDFPEQDETAPIYSSALPASPPPKPFRRFSGLRKTLWVEGLTAWNVARSKPEPGEPEWRGLSRFRTEAGGQVSGRFGSITRFHLAAHAASDAVFTLRNWEDHPDPIRSDAAWDADLDETWMAFALTPEWEISTGRQILVWGGADLLRVTDVLNPMDFREVGLCEVEDLRLPVWMSRVRHCAGSWTLTGVAVHEIRHHELPRHGSDFAPPSPLPPEKNNAGSLSDTEFALAATASFSGWDLGFYMANRHEDAGVVVNTEKGMEQRYPRGTMAGTSVSACRGNWIFIFENAVTWNTGFATTPSGVRKTQAMAGLEYAGFRNTTFRMESALTAYDGVNSRDRDQVLLMAGRMQKTFFHDTLTAALQGKAFGPHAKEGGFLRGEMVFQTSDTLSITFGGILYTSGSHPGYATIGENDRIFLRIRWEL